MDAFELKEKQIFKALGKSGVEKTGKVHRILDYWENVSYDGYVHFCWLLLTLAKLHN